MKALLMCLASPASNPRPNRAIRLLTAAGFSTDTLSYLPTGDLPITECFPIPEPGQSFFAKLIRLVTLCLAGLSNRVTKHFDRLGQTYLSLRHQTGKVDDRILLKAYDLIMVEDLSLLPLAFRLKKKARVIFDAREFYPLQHEDNLRFRLFDRIVQDKLCKAYLHRCDRLITVSPGIADAYAEHYDVAMEVVRSTPYFYKASVTPTATEQIRLVHHGAANRNRGLHRMIDIVERLDDRFTLDMYLTGDAQVIASLKNHAKGCSKVRFNDPVPLRAIVSTLNQYDIGLFYVEPATFNLRHCLPNKLFEFIQARLAVAIGPSPDMAAIVRQYECGFIADEFSIRSMAEMLSGLTREKVHEAKRRSDLAASSLCYEVERDKLTGLISSLGSSHGS